MRGRLNSTHWEIIPCSSVQQMSDGSLTAPPQAEKATYLPREQHAKVASAAVTVTALLVFGAVTLAWWWFLAWLIWRVI